jgi:hypothetical protein
MTYKLASKRKFRGLPYDKLKVVNSKVLTMTSKERTNILLNTEASVMSSMRKEMLLACKKLALSCLGLALISVFFSFLTDVTLFFIQEAFSAHFPDVKPTIKG